MPSSVAAPWPGSPAGLAPYLKGDDAVASGVQTVVVDVPPVSKKPPSVNVRNLESSNVIGSSLGVVVRPTFTAGYPERLVAESGATPTGGTDGGFDVGERYGCRFRFRYRTRFRRNVSSGVSRFAHQNNRQVKAKPRPSQTQEGSTRISSSHEAIGTANDAAIRNFLVIMSPIRESRYAKD